MTPSGLSLANSSASEPYSGTLSLRAMSAAFGETSTIAESCAERLFRISSMWRRPMRPAPATAIRTLRMVVFDASVRAVIPAQAGIQCLRKSLDPRFRGDDGIELLAADLVDLGVELLHEVRADFCAVLVDHRLDLGADLRKLGRRNLVDLHRLLQRGQCLVLRFTRQLALVALRFLCRRPQHVLLVLVEPVPRLLAYQHGLRVVDVPRQAEELLHLLQLVRLDHRQRVLLAVDRLLLER